MNEHLYDAFFLLVKNYVIIVKVKEKNHDLQNKAFIFTRT